ncbi:hypothetical protein KIH87_04370 [Paraneptunicella aestuarii]|uniref:hypothetical protein n=1 Tax=Paraneptunicella aestuarii TaxID=2831148 RepID=UPI001E5D3489|nr:hypothetical protein [Paraneptunicella aestuarii]UAA39600.1 hypothetical protein KIH87_04370 [Paraneptunicella aestuarii]
MTDIKFNHKLQACFVRSSIITVLKSFIYYLKAKFMKKIKLCCVVVLGLLAVTPVHASDNWLSSLFPWLNVSGVGFGGGHPEVKDKESIYTANGVGFGGGDPVSASGTVYVPNGAGNSGGNPSIPDPN